MFTPQIWWDSNSTSKQTGNPEIQKIMTWLLSQVKNRDCSGSKGHVRIMRLLSSPGESELQVDLFQYLLTFSDAILLGRTQGNIKCKLSEIRNTILVFLFSQKLWKIT